MPSKERETEADAEERPREKHRRSKHKEHRDDKERSHRSSKSSRPKPIEGSETHSHVSSRRHHHHRKRDKDKDKDDVRIRSTSGSDLFSGVSTSRLSFPYPSFSKAHSKEAVSREDVSTLSRHTNPFTPEPTDVGDEEARRSKSSELPRRSSTVSKKSPRPPTPPDTDLSADKKHDEETPREAEAAEPGPKPEPEPEARPDPEPVSELGPEPSVLCPPEPTPERSTPERSPSKHETSPNSRPKSRASTLSRSASLRDERSKLSHKSRTSSQATYVKHKAHEKIRTDSRASSLSRRSSRGSKGSPSTRSVRDRERGSSPSSPRDSSPRTPTQSAVPYTPHVYGTIHGEASATLVNDEVTSEIPSKTATPASVVPSAPPPPPPPPPPAIDIQDLPRVDYLLQNGGLAYPAPKNFLQVLPRQNGTRPSNPPLAGADTLFAPFFNLLDQYQTVLGKQGSIAVATGHRSVARRLLDRLENVFSRDLPPHGCSCVMCDNQSHQIHHGLTWGDVLEWVSGRIELPQWPPFDLAEIGTKAAEISAEEPLRPRSPVKMDPDIDEQFREHYLRQSKKVRSAVDKWLTNTGETPVPPSQDVDDETLTFAILTNLDADNRPFFNALLSGSRELRPATRAPTPAPKTRNDFLVKTGLSLQRLYRLPQAPRDAECACYLIKNPQTHDLLVTMANINNSEWEILTSGRFDGFLWSGADAEDAGSPAFDSRNTTPFSRPASRVPSSTGLRSFSPYSRGTTPASFVSLSSAGTMGGRHPVSNDEEMEMAAIAEIEREIYTGMESLEDAFEKLHRRAEMVRTALRQRGAGLMQNLQMRKRIDVLPPGSGNSNSSGYERPGWATAGSEFDVSDSECGIDDFEIMPDDSASNISSSRHRRPKRRTERRTPAPIEEGDEE
ncbi:unnamed protein product [Clonostachys byssicola]|uniref:5-Methylcytosine G/T mismatch-specific DNA glycosylase n=1 Tax=Clonostachys byssicola TaxID=160290 RepID=A0A9N9UGJ1_9HYPO|nr:unnamed protein product [Clonostachys byssicola]